MNKKVFAAVIVAVGITFLTYMFTTVYRYSKLVNGYEKKAEYYHDVAKSILDDAQYFVDKARDGSFEKDWDKMRNNMHIADSMRTVASKYMDSAIYYKHKSRQP